MTSSCSHQLSETERWEPGLSQQAVNSSRLKVRGYLSSHSILADRRVVLGAEDGRVVVHVGHGDQKHGRARLGRVHWQHKQAASQATAGTSSSRKMSSPA